MFWLEKVANAGMDVDVPWLTWGGKVEGKAVFNGEVTVLDDEAWELFFLTPDGVSDFFLMGGLPTFLLGSSLALGAARFFEVLLVTVCFVVCLGAVVTAGTSGTSTSICFTISGRRTLVEGCGISCNWDATLLGSISGTRTLTDAEAVSLVVVVERDVLLWTTGTAAGNGTNPGSGDRPGLFSGMLGGFWVSGVVFVLLGDSVGVFTTEGFLPLCLGVPGWFDEVDELLSDFGDCSEDTAAAPTESLGLGVVFFSFSLSGLAFSLLSFSLLSLLSFSLLSFSLLSFSFSFSFSFSTALLLDFSAGLLLKRTPLACTEK